MQDFFTILSNFGFPVAVASYLLFRFEKKLEELSKVNSALVTEVGKLENKITALNRTVKDLKKKK